MRRVFSPFVERTLTDINQALERSWFADAIARRTGALQALDPRLKILATILLLLAVSLSRNLVGLALLFPAVLILAALSRISIAFFMRRVWGLAFLFTGVLALPALFLTPGAAMMSFAPGIGITQTGLRTAAFLMLRAGGSISLATLTVLTTPWNTLLRALGILRLPDVIILLLGMTYRYIHLLLHTANDMFLARQSRILRRLDAVRERSLLGATAGVLLGKSLQLSGDVYLAMLSRGYRGYPRTLETFRLRGRDLVAGLAAAVMAVLIVWGI
jgi:cobalt/nickel transport system permease protein